MKNPQLVLHSPFNMIDHKATFVNYLEVIILKDGTIEYAIPSHQEKLWNLLANQLDIPREEVFDRCPKEYWCDVLTWLCQETGAIAVWNDRIIGSPNRSQRFSLRVLQKAGLFLGNID